jgi:hypothetical protein
MPEGIIALKETKFPLARGNLPPGGHVFSFRGMNCPRGDQIYPRGDQFFPRGGETLPQNVLIALSRHQNALAEGNPAADEGRISTRNLLRRSGLRGSCRRATGVACREIVVDRFGIRALAQGKLIVAVESTRALFPPHPAGFHWHRGRSVPLRVGNRRTSAATGTDLMLSFQRNSK